MTIFIVPSGIPLDLDRSFAVSDVSLLQDVTIVSTAMPTIVSELNGADLYGWVAIAYALVSTAVQPLYGKFSGNFFALLVGHVGQTWIGF